MWLIATTVIIAFSALHAPYRALAGENISLLSAFKRVRIGPLALDRGARDSLPPTRNLVCSGDAALPRGTPSRREKSLPRISRKVGTSRPIGGMTFASFSDWRLPVMARGRSWASRKPRR